MKKIYFKLFKSLNNFQKWSLYCVGSSYIKGNLINFLIKKKTINIHVGISPYYRGSDCNFWAMYDNNLHLVGGTVHLISKGLDSGPILFHVSPNKNKNPYLYTMSAVKLTIDTLVKKIKYKKLNLNKTINKNKKLQITYSRKSEFTDEVIKKFMRMKFGWLLKIGVFYHFYNITKMILKTIKKSLISIYKNCIESSDNNFVAWKILKKFCQKKSIFKKN